MLEHQSPAIDAFAIFAPSPVTINFFIFPATAALFLMKVRAFVIEIYCALAAITPNDREVRFIDFDLH